MSRFGVTEANPTDKTISLPSFFACRRRGLGGGARQKIERKWFWSGGRTRVEASAVARLWFVVRVATGLS